MLLQFGNNDVSVNASQSNVNQCDIGWKLINLICGTTVQIKDKLFEAGRFKIMNEYVSKSDASWLRLV